MAHFLEVQIKQPQWIAMVKQEKQQQQQQQQPPFFNIKNKLNIHFQTIHLFQWLAIRFQVGLVPILPGTPAVCQHLEVKKTVGKIRSHSYPMTDPWDCYTYLHEKLILDGIT